MLKFLAIGVVITAGQYLYLYDDEFCAERLNRTAWIYYTHFPNDRPIFKGLVTLALILCIADTVGNGSPFFLCVILRVVGCL